MTDIELELVKLVQDLRAENSALTEVILNNQGLLAQEVKVTPTTDSKAVGSLPWHIRQRNLTRLFRVPKSPVEIEEKDAS
jgi:hypothetical protein